MDTLIEFIDGVPEGTSRGEWYITIDGESYTMDYAYQGQGVPDRAHYGHAVRVQVGNGVPRLGQDDINHLEWLIDDVRAALNEGDADALFASIKGAEDFIGRFPCDFIADYDWCRSTIIEGTTVVLNGADLDDWLDDIPRREYIDGAYAIYDKAALRRWVLRRVEEELLGE